MVKQREILKMYFDSKTNAFKSFIEVNKICNSKSLIEKLSLRSSYINSPPFQRDGSYPNIKSPHCQVFNIINHFLISLTIVHPALAL